MRQSINLSSNKFELVWSLKDIFEYIINNSYDLGEKITGKGYSASEGFIFVTDYGAINYSREMPEWDSFIEEYLDDYKISIDSLNGLFAFDIKLAILELTHR